MARAYHGNHVNRNAFVRLLAASVTRNASSSTAALAFPPAQRFFVVFAARWRAAGALFAFAFALCGAAGAGFEAAIEVAFDFAAGFAPLFVFASDAV